MIGVYVEIAFVLLLVGGIAVAAARSWKAAGWIATVFTGAATVLAWIAGVSVLTSGQTAQAHVVGLPRLAASWQCRSTRSARCFC